MKPLRESLRAFRFVLRQFYTKEQVRALLDQLSEQLQDARKAAETVPTGVEWKSLERTLPFPPVY